MCLRKQTHVPLVYGCFVFSVTIQDRLLVPPSHLPWEASQRAVPMGGEEVAPPQLKSLPH